MAIRSLSCSGTNVLAPSTLFKISLSCFYLFLLAFSLTQSSADNEANADLKGDKKVLLKFAASITGGNQTVFQDWTANDESPCNWLGITCSEVNSSERVTAIELAGSQLQGNVFDGFSALTALSILRLENNVFTGQVPSDLANCKMLKILDLSSNFLEGDLDLRNLSSLEILNLSSNRFSGDMSEVLPEICENLISVNLSSNGLTGAIPDAFEKCKRIKIVDLNENRLVGPVWPGFGSMQEAHLCCNYFSGNMTQQLFHDSCQLEVLDLSENNLTGFIPSNINNCINLRLLDFSRNRLNGTVPSEMGDLKKLKFLFLRKNNFSRDLPESLANCEGLRILDMSENKFGGTLHPVFGRIKNLRVLVLSHNSYGPNICFELYDLSRINSLDLSFNNISGPIPLNMMHMQSLKFLILAGNAIAGNIPAEIGNLTNLQILDLSANSLSGPIPPTIGKLSNLLWLSLADNKLTGGIPAELGCCKSLLWLNLAHNELSGPIPDDFTSIGSNPENVFQTNRLRIEEIPMQLGICELLKRWLLPNDYSPYNFISQLLNRSICTKFWYQLLTGEALFPICPHDKHYELVISGYLQLSNNRIEGPLPQSIGNMNSISLLILSHNNLDGEFPRSISTLPLYGLNVSHNKFNSALPEAISDMNCLLQLDFSYNNFSGPIPESYMKLTQLEMFNVSYNPFLTGMAPCEGQFITFDETSYIGDDSLCFDSASTNNLSNSSRSCFKTSNGVQDRTNKNDSNKPIPVSVSLILCILGIGSSALSILLCILERKMAASKKEFERAEDIEDDGYSKGRESMHFFRSIPFTFTDVMLATANFSDSHIIGVGGYGTVYKGRLKDGTYAAVKRLHRKGPQADKEFVAEMKTLGRNGFQENLVPLLGCCMCGSEKVLVYEFISNKSLEHWLHEKPEEETAKRLNWAKRLKIAIGTAKALKFLHHDCSPAVIHRDLKASNILLDEFFNPLVSDFGLARLLDSEGEETHVSTVIAGTLGYVPPEYSQAWRATIRGDIYSFGVVLLELATGKRPLIETENGSDSLVHFVHTLISDGRSAEALDPFLLVGGQFSSTKGSHTVSSASTPMASPSSSSSSFSDAEISSAVPFSLMKFLQLAYMCTQESPDHRPSMDQVLAMLQSLASV